MKLVAGIDHELSAAIHTAGLTLTAYADVIDPDRIRERRHLQPAVRDALIGEFSVDAVHAERRLDFAHWRGLEPRRVGGVDLLVGDESNWRALIELKWCHLDSPDLGWAVWDLYKMATGRVSPGAEATYLIVGAPSEMWNRRATAAEVFATREWDTRELFSQHEVVFRGDTDDCCKLTALPHRISTTLVVDQPLGRNLADWSLKGVRVEVAPESPEWLKLHLGYLADPVASV